RCTSRTFMRVSPSVDIRCSPARPWASSVDSAFLATSWRSGASSRALRRMTDQRIRRLEALSDAITAAHLDGLLVSSSANVRYPSGFSGSSALMFVTPRETLLVTDFRYQTQVAEEVGDLARIVIEGQTLWNGLWQNLAQLGHVEVAGFESTHL